MALWRCKTLETFAVWDHTQQCLVTLFPAEFAPGEAEKQDLYIHQAGNINLQQDQFVVTVKIPGHFQFKFPVISLMNLGGLKRE